MKINFVSLVWIWFPFDIEKWPRLYLSKVEHFSLTAKNLCFFIINLKMNNCRVWSFFDIKNIFFYFILFILLFKSVKSKKVMPNGVHSAYWNDHKNSPNQKKENSKSAVNGMKRDAFLLSVVVPTKNCNPIPPNIGWVWDSLKLPFDKISFDWNAHKEYWIYSRLSINRIMNKWHTKDPLRKYEFHFRKFFHPNNGPDPLILEVRNSIPNLFFFLIFSSVCFSSHTVKTFSKRH